MEPRILRELLAQTIGRITYERSQLEDLKQLEEKARRERADHQHSLEINLIRSGHQLMQAWGTIDFGSLDISEESRALTRRLSWCLIDLPLTAKALREKFAALKEPPDPAQVETLIKELNRVSNDCWPYLGDNDTFR